MSNEPQRHYLAHITANQAQNLLDYFGGSPTTYVLIRCSAGECAPDDDGKPAPAGLYVYCADCPEEGVIYLGEEDEESTPTDLPSPNPGEGVDRIAAERHRQIFAEGYKPEHDDAYTQDQLLQAAATYIGTACSPDDSDIQKRLFAADVWPWHAKYFKPQNRLRDLERAGALIAAEIDRLLRAEKASA